MPVIAELPIAMLNAIAVGDDERMSDSSGRSTGSIARIWWSI